MADKKKTLHVEQVKSAIGCPQDQHQTLKAMGLGRIGKKTDLVDNDCVRGMIFKVKHLVTVTDNK